jgi:manganese transport protein
MPIPYELTPDRIREPPDTVLGAFRHIGPGLILSASIVGSGELIATTILGATAGFVTLWVILVSCLVKVTVQLEFGKHAIHTGEPTMLALNKLPGPRVKSVRWPIWTWLGLMVFKMFQEGGIVGGVVLILLILFPGVPSVVWAYGTAVAVSLLVFHGLYKPIERATLVMIGLFTVFTLASLVFLQATPFAVRPEDVLSGLTFGLPPEAVIVAIGAFGITGIGGDEIMAYNYWLLEKGYAASTGPKEDSVGWRRRARGWIRVMYVDAWFSMVVYTVVTCAFYLLGASVLHGMATVPEGDTLIESLATMYTESLGPWARDIFLLGGFLVLFSTLFSGLAAWTRQFSDVFHQFGLIDFYSESSRRKSIAVIAWVMPFLWATLFLYLQAPGAMVIIGGLATYAMLFVVVFAALYFRYRRLDAALRPSRLYDAMLWLSSLAIGLVGCYGLVQLMRP